MGRRSSVERLPGPVKAVIDAAIKRGATLDEILAAVQALGADVGRSSVGRYSKNYRELAERQRELKSVAETFAADFGSADDMQTRLMIQLITSVITRAVMPMASGEKAEPSPMDAHFLARAVKDILSAAKIDVEREAKIREEAEKRTKQRAAEAAVTAARKGGATPETIATIRREILGLS